MSIFKIRNALETRLQEYATSKSLKVVWENIATIPTTNYLKANMFASETLDPSLGVNHQRYLGTFRVVFYSFDINKGMKTIETTAEEIQAYFPRGTQLVKDDLTVNIVGTPSIRVPGYSNNYIYVAVDINYRTDVVTA